MESYIKSLLAITPPNDVSPVCKIPCLRESFELTVFNKDYLSSTRWLHLKVPTTNLQNN